jgi:hypothetical protein
MGGRILIPFLTFRALAQPARRIKVPLKEIRFSLAHVYGRSSSSALW